MRDLKLELQNYCPGVDDDSALLHAVLVGYTISKNGVTICDLRNIMFEYRYNVDPMIQVDCQKKNFTSIYSSPIKALRKFESLCQ